MAESIKISIEKDGTLEKKIKRIKNELIKWYSSLEEPFKPENDGLRLVKLERRKSFLVYEYTIMRDVY